MLSALRKEMEARERQHKDSTRSTIDETILNAFKEMYPNAHVILDAIEIFMEMIFMEMATE